MKKILAMALALVLALSMSAVAFAENKTVKVGVVTDVGGVNDKSFNQTTWEGLEALAAENSAFEINYLESKAESDYATNIEISDKAPQDYVSHYRQKLGEEGYRKTCKEHALPDNFENMDYMEFLSQRRILMAQTVRKAYQRLCE